MLQNCVSKFRFSADRNSPALKNTHESHLSVLQSDFGRCAALSCCYREKIGTEIISCILCCWISYAAAPSTLGSFLGSHPAWPQAQWQFYSRGQCWKTSGACVTDIMKHEQLNLDNDSIFSEPSDLRGQSKVFCFLEKWLATSGNVTVSSILRIAWYPLHGFTYSIHLENRWVYGFKA